MKIADSRLREIIKEEIEILNIRNRGQFGYVMQDIMDRPDEPISDDLYEPIKGKLILSSGETFNDITPETAYILMKYYNIEAKPSPRLVRPYARRKPLERPTLQPRAASFSTGVDDVESVASALMSHVRSGSPPLRSAIDKIEADPKRDQIAVYLKRPDKRVATDQEVACALRFLLDNRINPSSQYIINPCGYKDKKTTDMMMIVRL